MAIGEILITQCRIIDFQKHYLSELSMSSNNSTQFAPSGLGRRKQRAAASARRYVP